VQTIAVAGGAMAGLGILGTSAVNQVAILMFCGALFWDIRNQFAWLWPMHSRPSASLGARNFGRSLVLTGTSTLTQLQQNGLNLIVTSMLGAAALPALSTARTVASTFLQASNILAAPLAPEMVRFHVNREYSKLTATFAANWLIGGLLVQLGILAALPILAPLYMLWTRHALLFDRTLFALLAFAIILRTLGAPLLTYLGSVNDLRALSAINAAQAGTVLAIAALGVRGLGLRAAGVAILGGEVVGSFAMPIAFVLARLPGEWRTRLIRHAALTAAPALVSGTALLFYAHLAPLLPVIALSALLLVLLAWAQWRELPKEVHDRILGLLSRAAKRGRNAL
jgi:O-antigen/teichoic acid export membrane protein